jgi:hypothetical protein
VPSNSLSIHTSSLTFLRNNFSKAIVYYCCTKSLKSVRKTFSTDSLEVAEILDTRTDPDKLQHPSNKPLPKIDTSKQ